MGWGRDERDEERKRLKQREKDSYRKIERERRVGGERKM